MLTELTFLEFSVLNIDLRCRGNLLYFVGERGVRSSLILLLIVTRSSLCLDLLQLIKSMWILHQFKAICVSLLGLLFRFVIKIKRCAQQMSRLMGKPTICIGENKDADQLRGNREADQRLCFRYSDSTIPLLLKSEISSF